MADIRYGCNFYGVRLLSEHMNCSPAVLEQMILESGSLLTSINRLNPATGRRLQELAVNEPGSLDRLFGATHLLDPSGVADNWRPWRRLGLAS